MRSRRLHLGPILACALLAACAGGGPSASDEGFWPVLDDEERPDGTRVRSWLWPLVEETSGDDGVETRIGPLARVSRDADGVETNVLYPLFRFRRGPDGRDTDLRPLVHSREKRREDGSVDRDWAFLPFLYGGSDPAEGSYFMLLPLGGNVRGLFGKDEIRVALFPFYMDTRARGYESTHLLWPLISWGAGHGREDFRFLPFYSHEQVEGVRETTSVLWPFLHWGRDALDREHPLDTFFLFPFYGHRDSDVSWNRTYLYPLFTFAGNEDGFRNTEILWPIFRRTVDPGGRDTLRVWPLFGRHRNGDRRSDFWLWPIVWRVDDRLPRGSTSTIRIVPFMHRTRFRDLDGVEQRVTDRFWPILRKDRTSDGGSRLRMPAPIPFRGWDGFESSYGFLWSLVDHERDADGYGSTNLLFGLARYRRTPRETYAGIPLLIEYASEERETRFRILKGLAAYEESSEGPAIRLLWFLRVPL